MRWMHDGPIPLSRLIKQKFAFGLKTSLTGKACLSYCSFHTIFFWVLPWDDGREVAMIEVLLTDALSGWITTTEIYWDLHRIQMTLHRSEVGCTVQRPMSNLPNEDLLSAFLDRSMVCFRPATKEALPEAMQGILWLAIPEELPSSFIRIDLHWLEWNNSFDIDLPVPLLGWGSGQCKCLQSLSSCRLALWIMHNQPTRGLPSWK